jgi:hypothetical protein
VAGGFFGSVTILETKSSMRGAAIYKLLTAAAKNMSPPVNSVSRQKDRFKEIFGA